VLTLWDQSHNSSWANARVADLRSRPTSTPSTIFSPEQPKLRHLCCAKQTVAAPATLHSLEPHTVDDRTSHYFLLFLSLVTATSQVGSNDRLPLTCQQEQVALRSQRLLRPAARPTLADRVQAWPYNGRKRRSSCPTICKWRLNCQRTDSIHLHMALVPCCPTPKQCILLKWSG